MTTAEGTVGRYLGALLAALSAGAGVIHLGMAGEHFDVTWAHGAFFAVVGWLQLALAVGLLVRPERRVVAAVVGLDALVLAVWAASRLWGVPVGPGAGEPEPVGLADALASGFEAMVVVAGAAVLLRPALAARSLRPTVARPGLALGGVTVAVVSTMALTPAFAADHHHGADDHAHTQAAGEMAGMDHAHAGGGTGHDDGSGHAAGDGHAAAVIEADGTSPCERAGVANEGNSGHGARGPVPPERFDAATRRRLAAQVARADAVVAALPTVADAEAAGYRRVSPYVPCIAAHYIKLDALTGNGFDPAEPEVVLYAGTEPDSPVVGLSYLVFGDDEPEGFAGGSDPWHAHQQLCLGRGGVIGIETATPEGCAARGGRMRDVGNIWMTHMWNAPGWDSAWGLFSSENPDLGGRIGDIDAPPDPHDDGTWFEDRPTTTAG